MWRGRSPICEPLCRETFLSNVETFAAEQRLSLWLFVEGTSSRGMKYDEIRNLTFIAGNGRHENHRRKNMKTRPCHLSISLSMSGSLASRSLRDVAFLRKFLITVFNSATYFVGESVHTSPVGNNEGTKNVSNHKVSRSLNRTKSLHNDLYSIYSITKRIPFEFKTLDMRKQLCKRVIVDLQLWPFSCSHGR